MCAVKSRAETARWARRYQTALHKYLTQGARSSVQPALRLGREAVARGMETLDVARLHEEALMTLLPSNGSSIARQRMIDRASVFFAETISPIEQTHHGALDSALRLNRLNRTLRVRTAESSASAQQLARGVAQRQVAEAALKSSGTVHAKLLEEAHRLQTDWRHLTHDVLLAHEDERQRISGQLHDDIAQTLLGINVWLLTLKTAAEANTKNLKKEIDNTQRLVKASAKRVKRFAHEFVIQHKA